MVAAVTRLSAIALVSGLVAVSAGSAAPHAEKLLSRDATTRSFGSASTRVYLRNHPEYTRNRGALKAALSDAQRKLRDARDSIQNIGSATEARKRAQREFLSPYVATVKDVKAELARLARAFRRPFGAFGFRVQASPAQKITLAWVLRCSRGNVVSSVRSTLTKRTPVELWRRPPVSRPHSCYLQAYTRRAAGGRTTMALLGKR
jgi:hypothetical protein